MFGAKSFHFKRWVLSLCCALFLTGAALPRLSHAGPFGPPIAPQEGGGDGFVG